MMSFRPLLTLMIALGSFTCLAQKNVTGIWEGKINISIGVRIVFHIIEDSNRNITVTLDSPDQGVKDIKASKSYISGDSIVVEISQAEARYTGKLENDSIIDGNWMQRSATIPLKMVKVKEVVALIRPQTPRPPFPYKVEDIIYENPEKTIKYGATLTIPDGPGPWPALLLITGSGQQNRDEEIAGHKPFAVIADFLTRKGYLVMRVDDRGMGQSTGDIIHATSRDFANDVLVSLNILKSRMEVNKNKIGLVGHSEGGMIAEMIAAERNDINFIILLAGPGEKTTKLMVAQAASVMSSSGLPDKYVKSYISLYKGLLNVVIQSKDNEAAVNSAKRLVNKWVDTTSKSIVQATTGIMDSATKEKFTLGFMSQAGSTWFKYFLGYDPGPEFRKIKSKLLALNGDRDIQVNAKENLSSMKRYLKNSRAKHYDILELHGLNHLFQHCSKCTVQEYAELEETFAPEALRVMADWLNKNVK